MDAEQTLQFLRERNALEVKCKTGTTYTIVLPDMMRMMAHGTVPYGALRGAFNDNGTPKPEQEIAPEDQQQAMRAMYELYDAMLAEAVIKVDGQDVEMTPPAVRLLPPGDREELLSYINRERTLPKAESPT